jgi:tRNA A-37 threonylcarbamoyl transferase component Bud32
MDLLDQALHEMQSGATPDTAAWLARHPDLAGELPGLVELLRDLDRAALAWRPPTATLAETEARPTATPLPDNTTPPPGISTPNDTDKERPEQVGRYRILAELGRGGMGTVYKARDPQLNRVVALKMPRFDGRQADTAPLLQRFLREARAAAGVRHAHVCPIYDVGEHNGLPYVVMACIEGQSLADRLRARPLVADPREAVELVRQVAEGLAAVHAHGIIHRDLKPGNILLDAHGDALLTDFGLARPENDTENLTADGALVGTPAYMSPEQARSDNAAIGPASDVYSLGVVLYQMVTGRLPFTGPMLALLAQIANDTPPSPSQLRADLDPALEALIVRAMASQPADRFPNARAFADALRDWLAAGPARLEGGEGTRERFLPSPPGEGLPATVSFPGSPEAQALAAASTVALPEKAVTPPPRRWGMIALGGASAAGLFLAVGLFFLFRGHAAPEEPPPSPPPPAELSGELVVRVWSDSGRGVKRGWTVDQPGALPVLNDEGVRLEVQLSRSAYFYLVWVDASGESSPLYPWDPIANEDWKTPMPAQKPRAAVQLPERGADQGFPVDGHRGLDTILLLVRSTPLENEGVPLRDLIGKLPPSSFVDPREVSWLELAPGQTIARHPKPALNRGVKLGQSKQLDEPILKLLEQLRPHFELIKAVRFAHVEQ